MKYFVINCQRTLTKRCFCFFLDDFQYSFFIKYSVVRSNRFTTSMARLSEKIINHCQLAINYYPLLHYLCYSQLYLDKFIAFKTPLDDRFKDKIDVGRRWTCNMLINAVKTEKVLLSILLHLSTSVNVLSRKLLVLSLI